MKKSGNITLKDVAREAEVSYQTVSKVLNNKADWVSEKTRARVMDAVKKLGYEPNYAASSLRSGKKMSIGIIAGGRMRDMGKPDMARYFGGMGQRSQEAGYFMSFIPQCCRLNDEGFLPRIRNIVKGRVVDGLIMLVFSHLRDRFHEETLPVIREGDLPLVVLQVNAAAYDCPVVGYDIAGAGYMTARHLLERGYNDIACITRNNPFGDGYFSGYTRALSEAGLSPLPRRDVPAFNSVAEGSQLAAAELTSGLHRAYMISRDTVARGFIDALRAAGKRVPEDCAAAGCDRIYTDDMETPFLTTVDRKFEEHGYRTADMLFNILDGKTENSGTARDIVAPELLVRAST